MKWDCEDWRTSGIPINIRLATFLLLKGSEQTERGAKRGPLRLATGLIWAACEIWLPDINLDSSRAHK